MEDLKLFNNLKKAKTITSFCKNNSFFSIREKGKKSISLNNGMIKKVSESYIHTTKGVLTISQIKEIKQGTRRIYL